MCVCVRVYVHFLYAAPVGSFLLQSKVNIENDYKVQEETMIVWQEPDGSNHALSFQDKSGCEEIWEILKDVRLSMYKITCVLVTVFINICVYVCMKFCM